MEGGTIVVTGGDKGIGRAIVESLASTCQTVIFTYSTNRTGAEEVKALFRNVHFVQCDLGNVDSCKYLIEYVLRNFDSPDVLINNAGYENDSTFLKMDFEQWDKVIDINLRSLYQVTHGFLEGMINKKWGRIINLTSIAGFTGAFGKVNYAAAKAGIVGFTKSLAIEMGSKGITVNAIAPGAIKTDMLMRIPEKYLDDILRRIPIQRFGEPKEVADLVKFLVGDNASYITGQTIHINGGSYM